MPLWCNALHNQTCFFKKILLISLCPAYFALFHQGFFLGMSDVSTRVFACGQDLGLFSLPSILFLISASLILILTYSAVSLCFSLRSSSHLDEVSWTVGGLYLKDLASLVFSACYSVVMMPVNSWYIFPGGFDQFVLLELLKSCIYFFSVCDFLLGWSNQKPVLHL